MNKKVIIAGAFHEIIELAQVNNFEIIGLIDNNKSGTYKNFNILCSDEGAKSLDELYKKYPIIIAPDKPEIRNKLFLYYQNLEFSFCSIISVYSMISTSAVIGEGTIVQNGVNISCEVNIGRFVKLNTNCNIMHNSVIGDFTTIAPNAVILGNVKIGKFCYIGANATILPNIEICDNVIIGAGAVVVKNIRENKILVGNPAKELIK